MKHMDLWFNRLHQTTCGGYSMNIHGHAPFDPSAIAAFAASLGTLPRDEIRKAKLLYVRNAIAQYQAAIQTQKGGLIVTGILCIFPLFLVVFIPALIAYRAGKTAEKQKIRNALDVWKDDLGSDYVLLLQEIESA